MIAVILVAVACAVLGLIPLVGLPGALLLLAAGPVVNLLRGAYTVEATLDRLGPSSWALGIFIALLWPIALPVAFLLVRAVLGFPGWSAKFLLPMGAVTLLFAVVIATIVTAVTVKQTEVTDEQRTLAAIRADDRRFIQNAKLPLVFPGYGEPLYVAIANQSERVAVWLVEQKPGIPTFSTAGGYRYSETPLHFAATQSMRKLVEVLVARKMDINTRDSTGATVVHAALGTGRGDSSDYVHFLAKLGADYRAVDQEGQTSLMHLAKYAAPMSWAPAWAKAMIEAGADKTAKDKSGKTAFDYAKETYKGDLEDLLKR